ncbi:MAG TPA: His/Gly/Thr/Pro-type tRNA ligase C-terminal domain-containing protein, partial [Atribacterota bacterium]|nr:His/Gly/Thr/Pro-type tRNA ligase C-terminal domain-containing protein [Atribacterota bacterium]
FDNNIRVELDEDNEKIGAKIRRAEMQKIPYMLIFGDQEVENNSINVRKRAEGDLGSSSMEQFLERIKIEIREKS